MSLTSTLAAWLVVICAASACAGSTTALPGVDQAQGAPETRTVREGVEFTMRVGGLVRVDGSPITLRVERVESDSRCPVDVTCIWAGDAVVRLALTAESARAAALLHTNSDLERATVFQGRRITLVRLTPAPRSGVIIEQGDYEAAFLVTPA